MRRVCGLAGVWVSGCAIAVIAALLFVSNLYAETPDLSTQQSTPQITGRKTICDYDFPGLNKKISLDIRSMDIIDFLKFLAIEGELNIVATKNVTGPINMLINEVTIGDALEIVLSMNSFAYEVKGNIITVMTNAEYKTLYGVDFYDQRQTVIYQLKYASPKNVGAMLGNVKSEIGKIIYDDSTGTLIAIDTPAKIKEMNEVITKQEMPTVARVLPTETKIFELKYTRVDLIKDEVSKALTTDIGTMRIDNRTNTLIISDLPHQIGKIAVMIKAFDRKTREVFIEAKIVEATLTDQFQWGIQWDRIIKILGRAGGYTITPEVNLPLSLTDESGKLTIDTTSSNNLNVILEALSTLTETRILSNPHLTVEEGREAKIEVIEKQPYQEETTTTASGGTTTTSKSYQWVNVGVSLNVTPLINKDG
jgi:type II secretory pathway component GspD/PulD (secretin)